MSALHKLHCKIQDEVWIEIDVWSFYVLTFLSQSTDVKHLTARLHISVVSPDDLPFTRESCHRKIIKVQELHKIITNHEKLDSLQMFILTKLNLGRDTHVEEK